MSRSLILFILFIGLLGASSCTKGPSTSTDKRIKKQQQRQKRKPGDCPRIDCQEHIEMQNGFSI